MEKRIRAFQCPYCGALFTASQWKENKEHRHNEIYNCIACNTRHIESWELNSKKVEEYMLYMSYTNYNIIKEGEMII